MNRRWKCMKFILKNTSRVAWNTVHLLEVILVPTLTQFLWIFPECLANGSLIAVLLIHTSVINYVLINAVSGDNIRWCAQNHFALPFSFCSDSPLLFKIWFRGHHLTLLWKIVMLLTNVNWESTESLAAL